MYDEKCCIQTLTTQCRGVCHTISDSIYHVMNILVEHSIVIYRIPIIFYKL